MVKRDLDKLNSLTADKGYDWWLLRQRMRAEGVKPVIKYHEFGWHGIVNSFSQDDTIYHQRSNAGPHFSRYAANTARSFVREPGLVNSANSS